MQENLEEMIKTLNSGATAQTEKIENIIEETKVEEPINETPAELSSVEIGLTNFYDWYETYAESIHNITKVKAEVTNINPKDSIIFKIIKGKDESDMELVSFYNPATRPIPNLAPVYIKIFKNDTFEVLHQCNDEIFIKSYGVKTGLILMYCANIDGKIIPFEKIKIKKSATGITLVNYSGMADKIRQKLADNVDEEAIQLLYKQAVNFKSEFTTKGKTVDWFLKRQTEIIDINHLIKIDNVLINTI